LTKKTKSLDEDQLYEMMWDNDWKIVDKIEDMLTMLKKAKIMDLAVADMQKLIDKRYSILSAQMILDEVGK
tara:strand:- start:380 stop:592 length:213 start_codon:yes stop_codon:yes gene_type:complete